MSTHDYNLANQSGASFRSDLNNCLAAILSNNSNASSPSTTVAYMLWADTNSATLKIRNSANDDWVELFQLDGTLTLEDGSASTPALAFRTDLDTGIYRDGANTLNIATGGVERMELGATTIFNEDGADVDFRIEGDTDANLFTLNAGNEAVGIGFDPTRKFEVKDNAGSNRVVNIRSSGTNGALLAFLDANTTDDSKCRLGSAGGNNLTLKGDTIQFGSGDGTDYGRFNSSGQLGIGTTSINDTLHVFHATDNLVARFESGDTGGGITLKDNTHVTSLLTTNGAFEINVDSGGDLSTETIDFKMSGTSKMFIDSSGNLKITSEHLRFNTTGKGIIFGIDGGSNRPSIVGNYTSSSDNNIQFNTTGSTRLTIDASGNVDVAGNVLVGTNDSLFAENNLRFKSTGDAFIDHNTTGQDIKFRVSNSSSLDTTPVVITTAGLDVSGDVDIDSGGVDTATLLLTQSHASADAQRSLVTNASYAGNSYKLHLSRSPNSAFNYMAFDSDHATTPQRAFTIRGDGNAFADGTWNNNGADYAEFFESSTGSAIAVGTTVVLENNKVRASTSSDAVASIIGVVRPKEAGQASMTIGNTAWNKWHGRYLTDDFDRFILDEHNVINWTDADGTFHSYESHAIPSDVTVPSDAQTLTEDINGNKFTHYRSNPDFDSSKTYVPREERDEWIIVGLVGQVKILKGQSVNDRWVKMKDVSDTVEEYFIR
tara:strand:- start:1936 stop:4077 length:2142 start_codon:yes stop_codon:yes gene_type:complete